MAYPDLTATTLAGTITVPAGLHPTVTRRVATTYAAGVMTATVANAADLSDTPYPMVTDVLFTGPPSPFYFISGKVRGVSVAGVYDIKAENPFDAGFPQYFVVAADGTWGFFHPDNNPAHWTFTCIRIVDSHLYLPSWPSTAATGWSLSSRYGIQEQCGALGVPYPFASPASGYAPATLVSAHVNADFTMSAEVSPTPIGAYPAELRLYTFWDLLTDTAIGPPTFCAVPNRREAALGQQLDGLRLDILQLDTTPVWEDALPVPPSLTYSVSITQGTKGQISTVRTSDLTILARASMTNQFAREFFFYPGDTDTLEGGGLIYGSAFEEVCFPAYAAAVEGIVYMTRASLTNRYTAAQIDAAWINARLLAKGVARIVQADGGIPFAWAQCTDSSGPSVTNYRTGAIAWGAYYMFLACDTIPASYWTGDYAAWKTEILAAATQVLNWVYGQDPGTGMVRFGQGRLDPTSGVWDPTYQFDFYATEHNIDTFFLYLRAAITLSDPTWHTRAVTLKTAMLTYMWDETVGRFDQGLNPDLSKSNTAGLDGYSWGGMALNAMGESAKALRGLTRALSLYGITNVADDGTAVRGYKGTSIDDGIYDSSPSLWVEGTCGLLGFKKRMGQFTASDQTLYEQLSHLQQPDGSFRNYQLDDLTPFGIKNFRSAGGAAWYCLARDPNVLWWTETL